MCSEIAGSDEILSSRNELRRWVGFFFDEKLEHADGSCLVAAQLAAFRLCGWQDIFDVEELTQPQYC
jgi:hypothetical protein